MLVCIDVLVCVKVCVIVCADVLVCGFLVSILVQVTGDDGSQRIVDFETTHLLMCVNVYVNVCQCVLMCVLMCMP